MSHHRGSSNPKSNITEADIIAMRELRRDTKETLTQIGARFGLSESTTQKIVTGTTWSHVPMPEPLPVQPQSEEHHRTRRIYNRYRGMWGDEMARTAETVTIRWDGGVTESLSVEYVEERYSYVPSTYALPTQPYKRPQPEAIAQARIAGHKTTRRTTQGESR